MLLSRNRRNDVLSRTVGRIYNADIRPDEKRVTQTFHTNVTHRKTENLIPLIMIQIALVKSL